MLRPIIFRFSQYRQNTFLLLNITFIFDRCRRSSAAVTLVKYECDAKNLTGTLAGSKSVLMEKITNGALVTPTPGGSASLGARTCVSTVTTLLWSHSHMLPVLVGLTH